jgi:putative endonuclease
VAAYSNGKVKATKNTARNRSCWLVSAAISGQASIEVHVVQLFKEPRPLTFRELRQDVRHHFTSCRAPTLVDTFDKPRNDLLIPRDFSLGTAVAPDALVHRQKRFVYVIRSLTDRDRYYTGVTYDVGSRLCSHNAGECVHTSRNRPWELDIVIAFRDETRALAFVRYLKSGSGSTFAQRHLR